MAGLRELAVAPASPLVEQPGPSFDNETLQRASASEFRRGLRSTSLSDQAGAKMQAALEAAAKGDHETAAQLHGEAQALGAQAAAWSPTTPSVNSVTDVSSARDYAAGQVGSGLRSAAPSVAAAIAAGIGAKFGLRTAPGMTNAISGAAAAIPAYMMEKHQAVMNAANDPEALERNSPDEILGSATTEATGNAALGALLPTAIAGRTMGTIARAARPTLRGVAATVGGDMALQGGVGAGQQVLRQGEATYLNPQRDKSQDESQLVDAAVGGALTAPVLGAHTHALEAARAIAADVRERGAAAATTGVQAVKSGAGALGDAAHGVGIPLDADGAMESLKGLADRSSWLKQALVPPKEVAAQGLDAVTGWLKGQDEERYTHVAEALKGAGAKASDLAGRFAANAKDTYNEATDYLAQSGAADKAKDAVGSLAQAGRDFYDGLTDTKRSEVTDATGTALRTLFHDALPEGISRDSDSLVAADMLRRFAQGQLPPKQGLDAAHAMLRMYGDDAPRVAVEASKVLERGGTAPEAAQRLPKLLQGLLGDEGTRSETLTKSIDPLISNEVRNRMTRPLAAGDLANVAHALDMAAQGDNTHVLALHQLFGENLEKAVNVARAVHDASHTEVSSFNEVMHGPTTDETARVNHAEGERAVENSSPTIYSFADGPGKGGVGKPFDMAAGVDKVLERKETLERLYPGADVHIMPAEQYAREAGITPAALGDDLQGKAVLKVVRPTNTDALSFDRDTVKRLVKPTALTRDYAAGDEARGERYNVRTSKEGKQYTEVRRPGVDEGAMYVALNKADGTPLERDGKRLHGMVRADDLVAEVRKRDQREGVTTGEENSAQTRLQHLMAGITSLMTSEGTPVDPHGGLTFISPDGKKSRVTFDGTAKQLPDSLKVGKSTVGEIRKAANEEIQARRHDSLVDRELELNRKDTGRTDTDPSIAEDKGQSRILGEAGLEEPPPAHARTQPSARSSEPQQLALGTKRVSEDSRRPGLDAGETATTTRKRNEQAANTRPLTAEERGAIVDYAHKVLGPDVKVAFEETLGHAGEWSSTETERTMRIAASTGVSGMSVAYHEAMHGFFEFLGKHGHADLVDTLLTAAASAPVRRQLERLLVHEPAALAQLNTPEERAAFAYQFWAASKAGLVDFRIGPKTEGLFNKLGAFFRKALGIVKTSERAEELLQAFHDGKMTRPSAVATVLAELRAANPERWPSLKTMTGTSLRKMSGWFTPAYNDLMNSENGALAKIAEHFYTDPTSTNEKQGFLQARQQETARRINEFASILTDLKPEDMAAAHDVLRGITSKVANGEQSGAVNLTRQMLKGMYAYMKGAGVDVRERANYFPRVWDMDKITTSASEFKTALLEHHTEQLEELGRMAFDGAMKQYHARLEQGLPATKPNEAAYTAEKTAEHVLATLSVQHGYVDDTSAGKTRIAESAARPGFTPFMAAVNSRTLDFLDMQHFGKYLKDDFVNTMTTYIGQSVRRAEYARRFGNDGSGLATMMQHAIEEETTRVKAEMPGASAAKLQTEVAARTAQYAKGIMGMEGTLGYDISPTWRRINSAMVVYQNIRLLPLSLFSSLIDPQGILVRGGTVNDALDAFKRGILDISRGLHSDSDGGDAGVKMAEYMGTVENKILLDSMGQAYSSVYLHGWAKKINEGFFKLNGMDSWNRSMRIAATQAAIGFVGRHAKGESAEHSERWLAELGLKKSDVAFNKDGSVKVFAEEGLSADQAAKMRVAVQRFVDSAILRPNAAQRPAWASDPHYAMFFHLKQFTYSFHHVILKRAAHEWKNGNLTPALALASYVPVMVAADLARGLIQGGGSEPDWKKKWGLGDYVANGIQRSGLLGVGQIAMDAKNMGVGALGGPAIEQAASAASDPAYNTFIHALPANPAYRELFLGPTAPHRGQRDLSDLSD